MTNITAQPKLELRSSSHVAKTERGMVPLDCKLMAKIRGASPDFPDNHVQASFNDVRSKKYPCT